MTLVLATIISAVTPTATNADLAKPYWDRIGGCGHGHTRDVAQLGLTRLLRNHQPLTQRRQSHVQHLRRCTLERTDRKHITRHWKQLRAWRMSYAHRWPITFNRLDPAWQNWAYATGNCESGNNPATATGNGYYGAFQFLPTTWWAAGGTGYPNQHSWAYQAIVAVRWRQVAGAGQWPNCAAW